MVEEAQMHIQYNTVTSFKSEVKVTSNVTKDRVGRVNGKMQAVAVK